MAWNTASASWGLDDITHTTTDSGLPHRQPGNSEGGGRHTYKQRCVFNFEHVQLFLQIVLQDWVRRADNSQVMVT